jgi:hypothetical protein
MIAKRYWLHPSLSSHSAQGIKALSSIMRRPVSPETFFRVLISKPAAGATSAARVESKGCVNALREGAGLSYTPIAVL